MEEKIATPADEFLLFENLAVRDGLANQHASLLAAAEVVRRCPPAWQARDRKECRVSERASATQHACVAASAKAGAPTWECLLDIRTCQ
jgi:hypothetical protein